MSIEVEAHVSLPKPPAEVFAIAAEDPAGLSRFFTGYPPFIPPILGATVEGDGVPRPGAMRRVRMGDGSTIGERVLSFDPPRGHAYEAVEMNPLQRLLCKRMAAEWRFEESGSGTRIVWRYTLEAKPLRGPLARVVAVLLQKAMQRCLDNIASAHGLTAGETRCSTPQHDREHQR